MGLNLLDDYWIWKQPKVKGSYWDAILWVDDDSYFDQQISVKDLLHQIIIEKPDYIAFDDLRYVRQDKIDEA